ncbi:transposase [Enterococcus cecorum]|nr:transposase [Enterococcus cecorum]
MNTVHKIDALFNTNLSISHDGGCLSIDAGLILAKQFMHLLDFEQLSDQSLHFHDSRAYFTHSNISILEQVVLQLIVGYDTDSAANIT